MAKDILKEAGNEISDIRSRFETSDIRQDLEALREDARALKDDAVVLGSDLKKEGRKQVEYAKERARDAYDDARVKGQEQFAELSNYVQTNPGTSLAIAFGVGFIAKMLLTTRR